MVPRIPLESVQSPLEKLTERHVHFIRELV